MMEKTQYEFMDMYNRYNNDLWDWDPCLGNRNSKLYYESLFKIKREHNNIDGEIITIDVDKFDVKFMFIRPSEAFLNIRKGEQLNDGWIMAFRSLAEELCYESKLLSIKTFKTIHEIYGFSVEDHGSYIVISTTNISPYKGFKVIVKYENIEKFKILLKLNLWLSDRISLSDKQVFEISKILKLFMH